MAIANTSGKKKGDVMVKVLARGLESLKRHLFWSGWVWGNPLLCLGKRRITGGDGGRGGKLPRKKDTVSLAGGGGGAKTRKKRVLFRINGGTGPRPGRGWGSEIFTRGLFGRRIGYFF